MCGIAGIIGSPEAIHRGLPLMAAVLAARGPDGTGFVTFSTMDALARSTDRPPRVSYAPAVGLAHRRLAIIDVSEAASQPFLDDSGTCALAFNGELYNFLELRRDLEKLGHSFRTSSDTEVLLKAYLAWGIDCVTRFVGMWAFAILDTDRKVLLLCRDRFGIKPLYYTTQHNGFAFASEIKALLVLPEFAAHPDQSVVSKYLLDGTLDHSDRTFFDGIHSLPAATYLEVGLDSTPARGEPIFYWSLDPDGEPLDHEAATETFRAAFVRSVRLHLRSDVAVASCLSGGIDSSSIVSVASSMTLGQREQRPYVAFGFCSEDETVSERHYMELVAREKSLELIPVLVSYKDFSSHVEEIVRQQDEPFGSASIAAQWFVCRAVRDRGIKVLLDGQGADEILGGYHPVLHAIARQHLRGHRIRSFLALRRDYEAEIGPFPLGRLALLRAFLPPGVVQVGRQVRDRWQRHRHPGDLSIHHALRSELLDAHAESREASHQPPTLRALLAEMTTVTSLPQLLRYEDRNSMHHSIEARVPFLDHRLVEQVFRYDDESLVDGVTTKAVLRKAMRGIVPDEILDRRDKIGFRATPSWTFAFARDRFGDLASNETAAEAAWFEPDAVAALLATERRDVAAEFLIWRIVNTKLWARNAFG